MQITLDQFCQQWAPGGNTRILASKLDFNIHDFVTLAGDYTRDAFRDSFARHEFPGGKAWAPATSRWARRFPHPPLNDTGTLAKSIQSKKQFTTVGGHRHALAHRGAFFRSASYRIFTTEKSRAMKGKRGNNPRSGNTYAAVHNTDPRFGRFTVNQYSSRRPVQRQFIGFSPSVESRIRSEFLPLIFKDLPH